MKKNPCIVCVFASFVFFSCLSSPPHVRDVAAETGHAETPVQARVDAKVPPVAAEVPVEPVVPEKHAYDEWKTSWQSSLSVHGRQAAFKADFPVSCLAFAAKFSDGSSLPPHDLLAFFILSARLEAAIRANTVGGGAYVGIERHSSSTFVLYVAADTAGFEAILAQATALRAVMPKVDEAIVKKALADYWKLTGAQCPVALKDAAKAFLSSETIPCEDAILVMASPDVEDVAAVYSGLAARFVPGKAAGQYSSPNAASAMPKFRPEASRAFVPSGSAGGSISVCRALLDGMLSGFDPRDCWMQYPLEDPRPDGYPGRLDSE